MWWFGGETNGEGWGGGGGGGGVGVWLWVRSLLLLHLASMLCTWVFMYQTISGAFALQFFHLYISGAFLKGNQLSPLCYRHSTQCISLCNRL